MYLRESWSRLCWPLSHQIWHGPQTYSYVCIFVSLAMKAVHLEAVSDLISDGLIATLCHFVARRGHPSLIWSDNGTNFVGEP